MSSIYLDWGWAFCTLIFSFNISNALLSLIFTSFIQKVVQLCRSCWNKSVVALVEIKVLAFGLLNKPNWHPKWVADQGPTWLRGQYNIILFCWNFLIDKINKLSISPICQILFKKEGRNIFYQSLLLFMWKEKKNLNR